MKLGLRRFLLGAIVAALAGSCASSAAPTTQPSQLSQLSQSALSSTQLLLPAGARLQYDPRQCIDNRCSAPVDRNPVYFPPAERHDYFFAWDVNRVPSAAAIRWQLLYTPLVPDAFAQVSEPAGAVVKSGVQSGHAGTIEIDLRNLARSLQLTPFDPEKAAKQAAMKLHLPAKRSQRSTASSRNMRAGSTSAAVIPPSRLYIRVLPLRSAADPTPVGRSSNAIELIYGSAPTLQSFPRSHLKPGPAIEIGDFRWNPQIDIDKWPRGCEDIPSDSDESLWDVVSDAVASAWNWFATAYQDVQNTVVDVAHMVLPIVPKEVLSVALQSAMAAAGLPPSIPNLDRLMNEGADYLGNALASQIPVPAAGALGRMTQEAFEAEARAAAKKAILAGAEQARRALSGAGVKYCRQWTSLPWFTITVRNSGREDLHDIHIAVQDSAGLFKDLGFVVPLLRKGEKLRVPVNLMDRSHMNVHVTQHTQLPTYDEAKAEGEWWNRARQTRTSFMFSAPGDSLCIDAAQTRCEPGPSIQRYRSARKVWVTEGYVHRTRA